MLKLLYLPGHCKHYILCPECHEGTMVQHHVKWDIAANFVDLECN